MRVAITEHHLKLNKRLVKEVNYFSRKFSKRSYSKIEDIESILLKKDISVEKKKKMLMKELHNGIVKAFSINKKEFNKEAFAALKKKVSNLRKIIIKLRSINYYLETAFLEDLKISNVRISHKGAQLMQQNDLERDELEILEYTAYKLIEEAVMLDKKLLSEYKHKAREAIRKESIELNDIKLILRKESILLEHLEAKLPPANSITSDLINEPLFTHWVSRIFALLLRLEWLSRKETSIFNLLKKNKLIRAKISKKINHLIVEKFKLVRIMQEKAASMRRFRINNSLKKELHNFTTTISL